MNLVNFHTAKRQRVIPEYGFDDEYSSCESYNPSSNYESSGDANNTSASEKRHFGKWEQWGSQIQASPDEERLSLGNSNLTWKPIKKVPEHSNLVLPRWQ